MVFENAFKDLCMHFVNRVRYPFGFYLKSISTKYYNNILFKYITMNYTFYWLCTTRLKSNIFYFINYI